MIYSKFRCKITHDKKNVLGGVLVMKSSLTEINQRRKKIYDIVTKHPTSLIDLSKQLNVSEMTIRRDCATLEKMGMILRKKGIVHTIIKDSNNASIVKIEQILAKKAAKYIPDNTVVFINSSKTAVKAIQNITSSNVTVITNNLDSISHPIPSNVNVILSGGLYEPQTNMIAGDIAFNTFNNFHADYAIIGCDGLDPHFGVSTSKIDGARINRTIVKHSKKVILVTSYDKIGNISNLKIADISDVDLLITDNFADRKSINELEKMRLDVVQLNI